MHPSASKRMGTCLPPTHASPHPTHPTSRLLTNGLCPVCRWGKEHSSLFTSLFAYMLGFSCVQYWTVPFLFRAVSSLQNRMRKPARQTFIVMGAQGINPRGYARWTKHEAQHVWSHQGRCKTVRPRSNASLSTADTLGGCCFRHVSTRSTVLSCRVVHVAPANLVFDLLGVPPNRAHQQPGPQRPPTPKS